MLLSVRNENSWGGVMAAAKKAGAKFPEVVAAQWALESAWGEHTSGDYNYFGIKATGMSPIRLARLGSITTGRM